MHCMPPRRATSLACGLLAAACFGCQGERQPVKTLRIDEVPPALLTTAREKLPGVEFDTVWLKSNGTYEIRGRAKNGKIREVDIRPDGTVEEVE